MKPSFQDFDRAKCQHVTHDQFIRVMKKLNVMIPDEHVSELITRKYCDRGNTKEVNYLKFCQDVDRPQDMFPEYQSKKGVPSPPATAANSGNPTKGKFYTDTTKGIDVIQSRFSQ